MSLEALEKQKEKEKERKEKEKNQKEKEKVKHTRQMAVNPSLLPKQAKNKSHKEINNNHMTKTGPKNGGGQTDMPPQINNGAKMVAGQSTTQIG